MDSREAAARARLAGTLLFRGAPPEAVELARTDPRTLRQENGKGGVIYAPHAFRRCLGVVLEGRVQVNKGALIMSVLEPGDLFGAAALFQWKGIALAVVIFVCLQVKPLKKLHPIVFIAASAVIGAVFQF